jgi:hypothetical protein
MPLGALIFLILGFPVVIVFFVRGLRSDRMVNVKHGDYGDTKWVDASGNQCFSEVIDVVGLSEPQSLEIAESAIKAIGGQRIEIRKDVVQAWARFTFPYPSMQIGVRAKRLSNDVARYQCCSRPRYSTTMTDLGQGRRLAATLKTQIASITGTR